VSWDSASFRALGGSRIDGAGASHDLVKHLLTLSSPRRTVLFTCGSMITASDEAASRLSRPARGSPASARMAAPEDDKDIAEITGLMSRAEDWPGGLRWIARRVRPSRRHKKNMTAYEKSRAGSTPSPARTSRTPGWRAFPAVTIPITCWNRLCTLPAPS